MNRIGEILIRCYEFDVETLSQPWMYWCVLPVLFYAAFMSVKWTFLTLPAWMPLAIVAKAFRSQPEERKQQAKHDDNG